MTNAKKFLQGVSTFASYSTSGLLAFAYLCTQEGLPDLLNQIFSDYTIEMVVFTLIWSLGGAFIKGVISGILGIKSEDND